MQTTTFKKFFFSIITGTSDSHSLIGSMLEDREKLLAAASSVVLPQQIRDRKRAIAEKVKSLHTQGSTALGPALLVAVQLAGRVPGSRVVLCTDGCANLGLGKLEHFSAESTSLDQGAAFYQQLGEKAKHLSVTVNVVSFEGVKCEL